MTKHAAAGAVRAVFAAIAGALARGEDAAGFRQFSAQLRTAREGRNRRTVGPVAAGPSNTVSFRAGKALPDALN